jgi:hypothetical protein
VTLTLIAGGRHTGRVVNARLRRENRDLKADNRELVQRAEGSDTYVHEARIRACQDSMLMAQLRAERDGAAKLVEGLQLRLEEKEREHAEVVARIDERHAEVVADLEARLADMEQRLDIRHLAEAAAARTQEIPAVTQVMPLSESPLTTVDPAQLAALQARDAGLLGPVLNPGQALTPPSAPCPECLTPVPAGTTFCTTRCRNAADNHNDQDGDQ